MQKLESSLKNMVLVLVGVALVVGAVLAYINHLTSGPIAEKAAQSLATGIKSVMGTEDLQVAEPEEVTPSFRLQRLRVWVPRQLPGSRKTERVASSEKLQRMATFT